MLGAEIRQGLRLKLEGLGSGIVSALGFGDSAPHSFH